MLTKIVKTLLIAGIGGAVGYVFGYKKGKLDGYNEAIDDAIKLREDKEDKKEPALDENKEDEFVPGEEPENIGKELKKEEAKQTAEPKDYTGYFTTEDYKEEPEEENDDPYGEQEFAEEWFKDFENEPPEIITPVGIETLTEPVLNMMTEHHWYYYNEDWMYADADEERALEEEEVARCIGEALEQNGANFEQDDTINVCVINYQLKTLYHIEKIFDESCPFDYKD